VLFALGQHRNFRGRFADSIPALAEAIVLARECGDHECVGNALNKIGYARAFVGDMGVGLACVDEEIELRARIGQPRSEIAPALISRAAIRRMQGELDAAAADLDEALALVDRHNLEVLHVIQSDRARVAIAQGRLTQGRESLVEAMRLLRDMDSRYRTMVALDVASLLAAACGDWSRAALLQGSFDATLSEMGGYQNPYDDRVLARVREDTRAALGADAYPATYASGRRMPLERALAETLAWLTQDALEMPPRLR
jgi:tetratricopeptide (TPR) repeat protein